MSEEFCKASNCYSTMKYHLKQHKVQTCGQTNVKHGNMTQVTTVDPPLTDTSRRRTPLVSRHLVMFSATYKHYILTSHKRTPVKQTLFLVPRVSPTVHGRSMNGGICYCKLINVRIIFRVGYYYIHCSQCLLLDFKATFVSSTSIMAGSFWMKLFHVIHLDFSQMTNRTFGSKSLKRNQ